MTVLRKLEDKLGSELDVATFQASRKPVIAACGKHVAVTKHAANIRTAIVNILICMIEQVEDFGTKLEAQPLVEANPLVESRRDIPETRAAECVPRGHICGKRAEVVVREDAVSGSRGLQRSIWVTLVVQINELERIGVSSVRRLAVDDNRTRRQYARAGRIHKRAIIDREGKSRPDRDCAVEAPTAEQLSGKSAVTIFEELRLIVKARDKPVAHVKVRPTAVQARIERIGEAEEEGLPRFGERGAKIILGPG